MIDMSGASQHDKDGAHNGGFMKRAVFCVFSFLMLALPAAAQDESPARTVLIKAKVVSSGKYLIIARGYPRAGLTEKIQVEGTAKEAALLNAQILAKEKFIDSFDVVTNGRADKYKIGDGYADVYYYISAPNIRKYLRK